MICRLHSLAEDSSIPIPPLYIRLATFSTMNPSPSMQPQPAVEIPNANAINEIEVPGDQIVQWFEQLFEKSTTFASILAAIMFSAMILDFDNLRIPHGSHQEVRVWAATGAMLFVLLVLLCTGCTLGLKFRGTVIASKYDRKVAWVRFGFQVVSFLFQGLLLAGTLFFCLVVKAYVPVVGWTAFGITSVCLVACFIFWAIQFCTERRKPHRKSSSQINSG
jgi:hypothetical protein